MELKVETTTIKKMEHELTGGGDWSNTSLDLRVDSHITVRFEEVKNNGT